MYSTIIYYFIIIIILIYYYHHSLQYHFWYHLKKNLGKSKFYSGELHPNIYSKKNLTEFDKIKLVELYSNYMKGVIVNKEKIENFLSNMPYPEIFYMKVNSIYYGAVMNSIIKIKYKNKSYLSNFVDNAIVNNNYRDKGIFKELMNYVANYSNKMNAKFVIFKIDRKPIPSFYEYNFTSNYYYMTRSSNLFKKENVHQIKCESINNSKDIIILSSLLEIKELDNWEDKYFGFEYFGAENLGVSPFKKGATTMIFKRNSPESIELLYIYKSNKQNIHNIIGHLYNNYSFDILFVDDIGNNSELIKEFPDLFKLSYPVYHYILGLKEKIEKQNFFYYF